MKNKNLIILLIFLGLLAACNQSAKNNGESSEVKTEKKDTVPVFSVTAKYETTPVKSILNEDAADDPSVWIHPADPAKSLILGTNKKAGLNVYNLKGKELHFFPVGNVNNVDVCYNFDMNGEKIDLVGASNRSYNAVSLYKIDLDGKLTSITKDTVFSKVDDVYGFCFYVSPENEYYAIVNGKDGNVEQYLVKATPANLVELELVRTFDVGDQPEGMVADYETGDLYVGEEEVGVWKYSADPATGEKRSFVAMSDSTNPNIVYDVEGLTLYYAADKKGYLLVSSQGNFTYAVFERSNGNAYIGSFKVVDGEVDGTEETDGIDVNNLALGEDFPNGIFIAQDGFNYTDGEEDTQNFKMVPWENIAGLFNDKLIINNQLNIRSFCE